MLTKHEKEMIAAAAYFMRRIAYAAQTFNNEELAKIFDELKVEWFILEHKNNPQKWDVIYDKIHRC